MSKPPIKVMVVDDSVIIRRVVAKCLSDYSNIEVVTTAINGKLALDKLGMFEIDVVLLDIEMPEMNGLEALPEIVKEYPDVKVIMNSTLTKRNADITVKALSLGASDYIEKPSAEEQDAQKKFALELLRKIESVVYKGDVYSKEITTSDCNVSVLTDNKEITLRDEKVGFRPSVLAIGSSTGGPQVMMDIMKYLGQFKDKIKVPIIVVQHMPPVFTKYMAEHLTSASGMDCIEASDNEEIKAGKVYIAPGDYHMEFVKEDNIMRAKLNQKEEVNFCRPSVDVSFFSLLDIYKNNILAVILTGMGSDGADSVLKIADSGGVVISQNKESCSVWGMPRAAAYNGSCTKMLPPDDIAKYIINKIGI